MGTVCGLIRVVARFSRATGRGAAVFGVALALGLAAASQAAASPWTTAANLSEEGQNAYAPKVAVDGAGGAIVAWTRYNGSKDVVQAALKPAGEPWGKSVTLSEAGEEASEPQVAMDPAGDAVVVWRQFNGSDYIVQAAVKPAGEPWGKSVTLSEAGEEASEPQVAVNPAGDAVAVWRRFNGSDYVVQAALKPASEPWGKPAALSEAGQEASQPRVAVDAAGEATAVWRRYNGSDHVIQAAQEPVGEPWSKPDTLSEAGQEAYEPEVAVDGAGNATAVWGYYREYLDSFVQVAVRPAGGSWGGPATLSEAGQEISEPQIAVDAGGDAATVWDAFRYGECYCVQTTVKLAGEPWEGADWLTAGYHPRVGIDAAGEAMEVWGRYSGPGDIVQAALKPVGESWGIAANLSVANAESNPQVAMNAAGDATAVWTSRIGPALGLENYIVQAAQFSPSSTFTIETLQKLSDEPTYTKTELNAKVADTVDYEIIVKNTGSTSLKFGALKDGACEGISPAGATEVEASTEETFTCTHKLTVFVKYSNQASIEGNRGTGTKASNSVTVALAPVFEAPAGTADSNSGSCVETRTAVFACSDLRAAVAYANAAPGSTVKLERGVYQLGEAHGYPSGPHAFLEITAGLTIQGAGPGSTTIEQTDGRDPLIVIPYEAGFSQIEIEGVKLTGGVAAGEDGGEFFGWEKGGGALRIMGSGSAASSVTLTDDDLMGNLAHAKTAMGGAIFNKRTLNVIDSTIAHNTALAEGAANNTEFGEAYGGGIFNTGHLLIAGSTIADNTVEAGGVRSKAVGGGVNSGVENFSNEATAAIANTTITGNIASAGTTKDPPYVYGGGLAIDDGALNHVTLYGNTASPVNAEESWGGNVYEPQNGGGTWINNSIVAGGNATEGPNCMFTSGGSYPEDNRDNLEDGPSGECGFTLEYDPLVDVNPQLMPLADNGGPTETFALDPGSPAIDAGADCEGSFGESGTGWTTATVPLDVDQRGMPRHGHCDIGAFQTERPFAATSPQISGTAEPGKTLTCTPGTWTGEGTLTYTYDWLRNGKSTGDQTTSYTIVPSDAESQIACLVTVSGTYGSTEATSPSIEVPPNPPTVVSGTASSVTQTTATLNATVNPNGGDVTKCEFEYGPPESYTRSAPCAALPGSGDSAVAVSAAITGLAASTTYHFRILATNSAGTSDGIGATFTTSSNPPTGETGQQLTTRSSPEEEMAAVKKHEAEAAGRTGVLGVKETLPDATLTKTSLTAGSGGTLSVGVSCPGGTISCTGTITLKTLNVVSAATAHQAKKGKATILTLATGSFKVTGGHMTTVKLRLSPKARALLARTYLLRVRATIVARDPAGATHTTQTILTIRAAMAKHGYES